MATRTFPSDRRRDQDDDHEVGELLEQHPPWATALLLWNFVRAVDSCSPIGLFRLQTGQRVNLQALGRLGGRKQKPG